MVLDDYLEYKLMWIFLSVSVRRIWSYIRHRYRTKSADVGGLSQNPKILMSDFINYFKIKIFFYLPVNSCSFTLWKFLNVICFSSLGTISVVIPSIFRILVQHYIINTIPNPHLKRWSINAWLILSCVIPRCSSPDSKLKLVLLRVLDWGLLKLRKDWAHISQFTVLPYDIFPVQDM